MKVDRMLPATLGFTVLLSAVAVAAVAEAPDAHLEAAVPWKPAGISSPLFESHAAFDPPFLYREGEPEAWPPACPPLNRPAPPAPRD